MPRGRADRPCLSILCGVAIATASLPVAAATSHGVGGHAPPATTPIDPDVTPPVEPTPTDVAPPTTAESAAPPEPAPEPSPEPVVAATPAEPAPKAEPPTTPPPAKPTTPPADDESGDLPQRLTPMQTAGWWTLFGGVAVGTLAGVMAGLAERQEDRALRLSVRFDLDTGAQTRFEDVRGEYESTLRKGQAQANAGIALAVIGLAAAVAGIAVLGVAGVRQRKAARKDGARLQWRGDGMQVRF